MDYSHRKNITLFHLVLMMSSLVWTSWKYIKLKLIITTRILIALMKYGNLKMVIGIPKEISIRKFQSCNEEMF
jgi:hypothetical protein